MSLGLADTVESSKCRRALPILRCWLRRRKQPTYACGDCDMAVHTSCGVCSETLGKVACLPTFGFEAGTCASHIQKRERLTLCVPGCQLELLCTLVHTSCGAGHSDKAMRCDFGRR